MMRLTPFLLLLANALLITNVEGLAFVTGIMRPIVNPVVAFRRQRSASAAAAVTAPIISTSSLSTTATADDEVVLAAVFDPSSSPAVVLASTTSNMDETMQQQTAFFGSDESTRACRSEMLDLVYQRSLDRMDSFSL